jgi:putative RNA 2'-phosphotransferase
MAAPDRGFDPTAVSRRMAYLLRHDPAAGGLVLDRNGWADLPAVRFPVTPEDVAAIVARDPKRRHAMQDGGIRAVQGHSVPVDLGLAPAEPPQRLYHGTVRRFLDSIFRDGLVKGTRSHVHLSPDIATARAVAARRRGSTPVILDVDAEGMARAGHVFLVAENGVWLTERVPPAHLSVLPETPAIRTDSP